MSQVNKNTTSTTTSFIAQLDALAAQREDFQIEYDAVNKKLYELLAQCLSLYCVYQNAANAQEAILKAIKAALEKRNMPVSKKHTTTLSLIVRYVFNASSRRAQVYVRALGVAVNLKVVTEDFADWVERAGGLEEVLAEKTYTPETLKKRAVLDQKVSQVKFDLQVISSQPLAIVPQSPLMDLANITPYTLLLGKTQPDGTTHVLSIVPNTTDAMSNAALAKIAKAKMAYEQQMHAELQEASNDAANEASIDESIDLSDFLKVA